MVSNRNLLFQTSIFRCYVSCREGTTRVATKSTRKQCSLCVLKYQDVFLTEMMWNLVERFVQLPLGNTCPDTHRMRWCKSLALLLSQYFCPRPRLPAVQQPGCRLFVPKLLDTFQEAVRFFFSSKKAAVNVPDVQDEISFSWNPCHVQV